MTYISLKHRITFLKLTAPLVKTLLISIIGYFQVVEMEWLNTIQLKEYLVVSGKHLKLASLAHRIRFMKPFFVDLMKKAT